MGVWLSALLARRPHGMAWLPLLAVATFAVLILMIARAEGADGDPYADAVTLDAGAVWGELDDTLGADDDTFIQIVTQAAAGIGVVTLTFQDNIAFNGAGPDLRIHVIDDLFPAWALIEVSADGEAWVSAGVFVDTADIDIDLSDLGTVLPFVTAVRLSHDSGDLPGFDLDAVEALHSIDPSSLTFDVQLPDGTPRIRTLHTLTATLTQDNPLIEPEYVALVGVEVSFAITAGPHEPDELPAIAPTDGDGETALIYLGNSEGGEDIVDVWLDVDGDGEFDEGSEPGATVSVLWIGYTGTITLTDIDDNPTSTTGSTLLVTVTDEDLDLTIDPDTVEVIVFSTSDPVGLVALVLTETEPTSGIFEGTFRLAGATTIEGPTLLAAAGDVVTASYDDLLDAFAEDPEPVTATRDVTGFTGTIALIDLDGEPLDARDDMMVIVADPDLDVSGELDEVSVLVTSSEGDPAGFEIVLTETGPLTGVFTGNFALDGESDPEAALLAATTGETITVAYEDAIDAEGNENQIVTDSQLVTRPPPIDGLEGEELDHKAKVTVCHIPRGNPANARTLSIGAPAVYAHTAHGDTVGAC